MSAALKPRPKYYDLNLAHLPAAGLLSIFHRVSGALLFFPMLFPLILFIFPAMFVVILVPAVFSFLDAFK